MKNYFMLKLLMTINSTFTKMTKQPWIMSLQACADAIWYDFLTTCLFEFLFFLFMDSITQIKSLLGHMLINFAKHLVFSLQVSKFSEYTEYGYYSFLTQVVEKPRNTCVLSTSLNTIILLWNANHYLLIT